MKMNPIMKSFSLVLLLTALLLISFSCKNQTVETSKDLKTELDSVSFALGTFWGNQVKSSGLEEINFAALNGALEAVLEGDSAEMMDVQEASMFLQEYFGKLQEQEAQDRLEEGREFLEENKNRPEVKVLDSGLQYEILEEGTGATPDVGDQVKAHYTGTLIDGTVFDSSVERGEPFTFTVGEGVIPAWSEIVQIMKVGAKYKIYVPTELGYGTRVRPGGVIKANDALIFEIELLEIVEEAEENTGQ
jgi:FKBP-type peptidyl-prolyl cis-trans isomerase